MGIFCLQLRTFIKLVPSALCPFDMLDVDEMSTYSTITANQRVNKPWDGGCTFIRINCSVTTNLYNFSGQFLIMNENVNDVHNVSKSLKCLDFLI